MIVWAGDPGGGGAAAAEHGEHRPHDARPHPRRPGQRGKPAHDPTRLGSLQRRRACTALHTTTAVHLSDELSGTGSAGGRARAGDLGREGALVLGAWLARESPRDGAQVWDQRGPHLRPPRREPSCSLLPFARLCFDEWIPRKLTSARWFVSGGGRDDLDRAGERRVAVRRVAGAGHVLLGGVQPAQRQAARGDPLAALESTSASLECTRFARLWSGSGRPAVALSSARVAASKITLRLAAGA